MNLKSKSNLVPTEAGIYMFKNLINNKVYVGQAVNLRNRFKSHRTNFTNSRYDNPLYRAIHKYGIDSFEYIVLKTLETIDKNLLDKLEIQYIEEYDSYNNGYNQTKGGDGGVLGYRMTDEQKLKISKAVTQRQLEIGIKCYAKNIDTGEIICGNHQSDLARKLEVSHTTILRALNKNNHVVLNKYIISLNKDDFKLTEDGSDHSQNSGRFEFKYSLEEFYNKLLEINYEKLTIPKIAEKLNICKKTAYNYFSLLKETGYNLSCITKGNIDYYEIYFKEKLILSGSKEECAKYFSITVKSFVRQSNKEGIYKKYYTINKIYK